LPRSMSASAAGGADGAVDGVVVVVDSAAFAEPEESDFFEQAVSARRLERSSDETTLFCMSPVGADEMPSALAGARALRSLTLRIGVAPNPPARRRHAPACSSTRPSGRSDRVRPHPTSLFGAHRRNAGSRADE